MQSYNMPKAPVHTDQFQSLVDVVKALRGPEGCPWDKEQTHRSLTQYAIEEAHELAEAIDQGDLSGTVEELGDLLLQVVLHAEIARQAQTFTLEDVIRSITEKMIRRHPHVFGDVAVQDSAEVLKNWGQIKDAEKAAKSQAHALATGENPDKAAGTTPASESPFSGIPESLPALLRSQKIGHKTVRFNFDWANPWQVIEKVEEELGELKEAMKSGSLDEQQAELGDLLFSVVQVARHLNFDSEQSLRLTNKKFERRFVKMRELVEKDGKVFSSLPVSELETYWVKAKNLLKTSG